MTRTLPSSSASRRFYAAVWRWHFMIGVLVIPFLFLLAFSGLLMLLSKQVPMKCSDLVRATGKAQPQISSICKTLRERGAIDRLDDGAYQIRLTQQF